MSLVQIQEKSERLRHRTRRTMIVFYVLILMTLVPFGAIVAGAPETRFHIGFGLFIAGTLYFTYQTHRRFWPGTMTPDAGLTTSLEFYRSELLRQHNYSQWFLGPLLFFLVVLLGVITLMKNPMGRPVPVSFLPILVPGYLLLGIWAALVLARRRRGLREFQREIDAIGTLGEHDQQ